MEHEATDSKCPFSHNRHKKNWYLSRYERDTQARRGVSPSPQLEEIRERESAKKAGKRRVY